MFDDLFYYDGELGVVYIVNYIDFKVWVFVVILVVVKFFYLNKSGCIF